MCSQSNDSIKGCPIHMLHLYGSFIIIGWHASYVSLAQAELCTTRDNKSLVTKHYIATQLSRQPPCVCVSSNFRRWSRSINILLPGTNLVGRSFILSSLLPANHLHHYANRGKSLIGYNSTMKMLIDQSFILVLGYNANSRPWTWSWVSLRSRIQQKSTDQGSDLFLTWALALMRDGWFSCVG